MLKITQFKTPGLMLHIFLAVVFMTIPALSVQADDEPQVYLLKANDQIVLSVFGEPDMSKEVQLTVTGEASLPLIGAVRLAGMSLKESEEVVTDLYRGDYLIEPCVNINLVNTADERVTVMGAVASPGQVSIPPNTTLDLVGAIDSVGGLAPQADADRVELKRGETSTNYTLSVLCRKGALPVMLRHGDRVNVPTSPYANKVVTVIGEVNSPGKVDFPNNGVLDLATVIALSGNLTPLADPDRILVKREGRSYSMRLGGTGVQRLVPRDIVTVPKSVFAGKVVTVMGQVSQSGVVAFPLDGRLDLLGAVALAGGFERLANQKKVSVTRIVEGRNQTWTFDASDMQEGKAARFPLVPSDIVSVPVRRF